MGHKSSKKDLVNLINTITPYIGCHILHVKTGNEYIVEGAHIREENMGLYFTYSDIDVPELEFSRPAHELLDGRYIIGGKD